MSDFDGIPEHWGAGHYRDVPICELVAKARARQVSDLRRASAGDPDFPYYYDDEAADRAVWFFSKLRHHKGKWFGRSFLLTDWQEWDLIRPLFGWRRRDNGLRRFRRASVWLPKKNGKTTVAAGIAAFMFLGDYEPGAEVFAFANAEEQAREVWGAAERMIRLSPELRSEVQFFRKSLYAPALMASFLPIGRDSKTREGMSVHGAVGDEIHAARNRAMLDMMGQSMAAREQPLLVTISTFGYSTEKLWLEEVDYATKILNGTLQNETVLAYVAAADNPDDWESPEQWKKANPNYGISIFEDGFRQDYEYARQVSTRVAEFKSKRLNLKVESLSAWLPMERWRACGGAIDWEKFKGARCYGGLDLGISQDLSALVLAFKRDDYFYLFSRYWIPEEGLKARWETDQVPYPLWRDQGWIKTTPGAATRQDMILADIVELGKRFDIAEVAADQAHAARLLQDLADEGFTVVKHSQGMTAMTLPMKELEDAVLSGRIRHGDDPVLTWMAENAVAVKAADERTKLAKDKSTDRIDGIVAACMAVGRLTIAKEPEPVVYESRGLLRL